MNYCERRYKIHLELRRRILSNKKKKKYTNNTMPQLFLFLQIYGITFTKNIEERNTVSRGRIIEKCIKGARGIERDRIGITLP